MRYRELGKTGKECSVIGFGGMRFPKDKDEAIGMVRRAVELGINYFDSAPGYCEDRSEDILGQALEGLTDKVYLSTKSSVGSDPKAGDVIRRIEGQLERMKADKIHFYHMWCILDVDQFNRVIAPGGPLDGALKARDQGLIDHIFFSAHANGEEIEQMLQKTNIFEGVTLGYSAINHTNRYRGLRAASKAGLGVVTMNPLGGGMIPKAADRFRYLISSPEQTPVQAALRFLLYHPEIDIVLCGMGSLEDVERNAAEADRIDGPDAVKVSELKERIQSLGETYCTMCKYCMPCQCDINIPYWVFAVDRHRLNDAQGAKDWITWLKNNDKLGDALPSSCNECGECLDRCTQKLPIPDRLKEAVDLFE
ncbi:aldo/keto reductase [Acidobacteriota bacterium]